jgi:hypothetical protein
MQKRVLEIKKELAEKNLFSDLVPSLTFSENPLESEKNEEDKIIG